MPLVTWAPTTEPADVPITRSAPVRSTPASDSPLSRPSSHAMPVMPPPPRTSAVRVMSETLRASGRRVVGLAALEAPRLQARVARDRAPPHPTDLEVGLVLEPPGELAVDDDPAGSRHRGEPRRDVDDR